MSQPGPKTPAAQPQADGDSTPLDQPSRDEIATTAYYLFVSRGRRHGYDVEDWIAAEQELRQRRSALADLGMFDE
jgi:hypothetical protein